MLGKIHRDLFFLSLQRTSLCLSSVWIIVCMSFERYFAVSRPLTASQTCTTRRAKWVKLNVTNVNSKISFVL